MLSCLVGFLFKYNVIKDLSEFGNGQGIMAGAAGVTLEQVAWLPPNMFLIFPDESLDLL
jgi:hypothetical protein